MFGMTLPTYSNYSSFFYINKKRKGIDFLKNKKIFRSRGTSIEYSEHFMIEYFLVKI